MTAVFIRNGELFWCGIGDSHIYLYRAGELRQLNIDHNFGVHLDQMVQEGSITTEEALRHPQRAALTSYLGIQELTLISGNRIPFPLQRMMYYFNVQMGCIVAYQMMQSARF